MPALQLNLVTAHFFETWDFYTEILGFRTEHATDIFVQLVRADGCRLGILAQEQDGGPAELVSATTGRGYWLSFDVADLAIAGEHLAEQGFLATGTESPLNEASGRILARDPNGILLSLGQAVVVKPLAAVG